MSHGQTKLTKADLVDAVQSKMGLSRRETREFVDGLLEVIKDTLVENESVKISGFGVFEVRSKKARPGRNPKTGEQVTITSRRVMTFKPSQILKKALKEPT